MTAGRRPPRRALVVGGRALTLSNEEKVFYPATGFTKGDLVAYYLAASPALLPHLAGRPVTLARFPDGVDAPGWYQTNCPPGRPPWLPVAEVRGARGQAVRYCRLEEPAALAWAANTGAIELHPLLATAERPDTPHAVVFDLDPGVPANAATCAQVALRVRTALAARGLAGYAKTSGGRGLHVYARVGGASFRETQALARAIAAALTEETPHAVTDEMPIAARAGKVLVDWRQNSPGRSLIAPWSLRAAAVPLVSTPLAWCEVEAAARARDPASLRFGPAPALARLARDGDLFAPVLG